MHHGPELGIALTVALALTLGAVARGLSPRTGVPYTVAMLLLGMVTGLVIQQLQAHDSLGTLGHLLASGTSVSPDLILFVFLPTLVFESAFSLDFHQFRRSLGTVSMLAVPVLVVNIALVAGLMMLLTGSSWGWSQQVCLVFGALICATDPVAVVALLKELGVSKRLGILIEGESLFNDGTAIVAFTVLSGTILGAAQAPGLAEVLFEFTRVVVGGVLVGLVLVGVIGAWVGRVFNDPLVEITLTLILAYLAMIVAEAFLHVSGVMAVVVAGLWLGGPLRTSISPEVFHLLHRAWEMLAYVANTLIFWLVGLVMATQVPRPSLRELALIGATYIGIMAIRFLITFGVRPLSGRFGDPLSKPDCLVLSWGGLRGAVSLALALTLFENPALPEALRGQILLATAGVVLLSILVNGVTMKWVLDRAGYGSPPLPVRLAQLRTIDSVLDRVGRRVHALSDSRSLRVVAWGRVEQGIQERQGEVEAALEEVRSHLRDAPLEQQASGYWVQVLAIERECYWQAFGKGTLSQGALRFLSTEVDWHKDRVAHGTLAPPEDRVHHPRPVLAWLIGWLRRSGLLPGLYERLQYADFSLQYDICLGVIFASSEVLKHLDRTPDIRSEIRASLRQTYAEYGRRAKEMLEELRLNLPEVAQAVETALASRIALNLERDDYRALARSGAIDENAFRQAMEAVEERMLDLRDHPMAIPLPGIPQILCCTPLFRRLDEKIIERVAAVARELVLPAGEYLFRQGEPGSTVYIVGRGAVHILVGEEDDETVVNVLGGGEILGEIALLTDCPRTASVRAATPATLVAIEREDIQEIVGENPALEEELWDALARHRFLNYVREVPRYSRLSLEEQMDWYHGGVPLSVPEGDTVSLTPGMAHAFLFLGGLRRGEEEIRDPALIEREDLEEMTATEVCRLLLLPPSTLLLSKRKRSA